MRKRKIEARLPPEDVDFIDAVAERHNTTRTAVLVAAIGYMRELGLMFPGYRFDPPDPRAFHLQDARRAARK